MKFFRKGEYCMIKKIIGCVGIFIMIWGIFILGTLKENPEFSLIFAAISSLITLVISIIFVGLFTILIHLIVD